MSFDINEKNIKLWSTIGPRASFGMSALDLIKKFPKLMILTCDVSTSAGLDRFRKLHPDNYFDLGIAEQNLIGVAAGIASEGYNVVTTTFAPFQVMRCCEQIKVNAGYMKQKITMVGIASGLVLGNLGYTHCCIEDIGVIRSIPNINIISPADSFETVKAFEAVLSNEKSSYIRITGAQNNPIVYKQDYKFKIGKAIKLLDGEDVAIFCNGALVKEVVDACEELKKKQINASIINMHTIKPIDKQIIIDEAKKSKLFLSVEEHNIIGGLGSAISEVLSELNQHPRLIKLGISDTYTKGGSYLFLKKKHGLDKETIVNTVTKNLNG